MYNADAMSADAASLVLAAAAFVLACCGLATVALLGYIAWVVRDGHHLDYKIGTFCKISGY